MQQLINLFVAKFLPRCSYFVINTNFIPSAILYKDCIGRPWANATLCGNYEGGFEAICPRNGQVDME